MKKSKFGFKYDIAVSGSAHLEACIEDVEKKAYEVGKELAKNKCVVISGATTGVPYVASCGCRDNGGLNVGFSPAASKKSHIKRYKLPFEPYDVIIYTGANYAGRDVIMTKSSEAVIIVAGGAGTMHEFLTAFETGKIIGVLEGTGGIAADVRDFLGKVQRKPKAPIIYDINPKSLVKKVIQEVEKSNNIINGK